MKKDIAKRLNDMAEVIPKVFDWVLLPEVFTGAELNLSGYGETFKYDPAKNYEVMIPAMVAVCHKQQLKDAYKRGGTPGVKRYYDSVNAKAKAANKINIPQ